MSDCEKTTVLFAVEACLPEGWYQNELRQDVAKLICDLDVVDSVTSWPSSGLPDEPSVIEKLRDADERLAALRYSPSLEQARRLIREVIDRVDVLPERVDHSATAKAYEAKLEAVRDELNGEIDRLRAAVPLSTDVLRNPPDALIGAVMGATNHIWGGPKTARKILFAIAEAAESQSPPSPPDTVALRDVLSGLAGYAVNDSEVQRVLAALPPSPSGDEGRLGAAVELRKGVREALSLGATEYPLANTLACRIATFLESPSPAVGLTVEDEALAAIARKVVAAKPMPGAGSDNYCITVFLDGDELGAAKHALAQGGGEDACSD